MRDSVVSISLEARGGSERRRRVRPRPIRSAARTDDRRGDAPAWRSWMSGSRSCRSETPSFPRR